MAVITPTVATECVGTAADGSDLRWLKCLTSGDPDLNTASYDCRTWRFFKVKCPKLNQLCNQLSGAWVPAATICRQGLYTT